jgi:hypothetical protein
MFQTSLCAVILFLLTTYSALCLGFTTDEEGFKPNLQSGLKGTALKPQDGRIYRPSVTENNFRHNSSIVNVAGILSPNGNGQNGSVTAKEETTEQLIEENGQEVLETQHATCRVTTEQLVATAQATVTRVLKGLCNASKLLLMLSCKCWKSWFSLGTEFHLLSCDLHLTHSETVSFLFPVCTQILILERRVGKNDVCSNENF